MATGRKSERGGKNLHFPLEYQNGGLAQVQTYNGYLIQATNAVELSIPALPADAPHDDFTRCKNRRFGEAYLSESETT